MEIDMPHGNSSEGKLLDDERFLRRVARLYYEQHCSQEEIAQKEYCSRQTIGKALRRAEERDIVRISIVPELRMGYLRNLTREVRLDLGLEDLVLVAGRNFSGTVVDEIVPDVMAYITNAAAEYLDQLLTDKDILAVSGGRNIMRQVVRYLKPSKFLPNLQVVSTIGFVKLQTTFGDTNLIAFDIATAYGAKHAWLPIPAIVETQEQCQQARALPLARDVLKMLEEATVIMLGLWPMPHRPDVVAEGVLSQAQIDLLLSHNPAVDINHWSFDRFGKCINDRLTPPPYYLTGFEIPRLKEKIRTRNVKVILVAGAGPSYAPAIRAALKAGVANILITDHITAELLMEPESS
jgi:deoxyribonucleoside regulator